MTTTPNGSAAPLPDTVLPRSQDEITERAQRWMDRALHDPLEKRHEALAQVMDREHASQLLEPGLLNDKGEPAVNDYPETAPTTVTLIRGLIGTSLPILTKHIMGIQRQLEDLAEYMWVLGRPDVSEAMVPDVHSLEAHMAAVAMMRFCRALSIPVDLEGMPEVQAATLRPAIVQLDAEDQDGDEQ